MGLESWDSEPRIFGNYTLMLAGSFRNSSWALPKLLVVMAILFMYTFPKRLFQVNNHLQVGVRETL